MKLMLRRQPLLQGIHFTYLLQEYRTVKTHLDLASDQYNNRRSDVNYIPTSICRNRVDGVEAEM